MRLPKANINVFVMIHAWVRTTFRCINIIKEYISSQLNYTVYFNYLIVSITFLIYNHLHNNYDTEIRYVVEKCKWVPLSWSDTLKMAHCYGFDYRYSSYHTCPYAISVHWRRLSEISLSFLLRIILALWLHEDSGKGGDLYSIIAVKAYDPCCILSCWWLSVLIFVVRCVVPFLSLHLGLVFISQIIKLWMIYSTIENIKWHCA
jgi:hypothetical protein